MAKTVVWRQSIDARPWTFYALGSLFFLYLLFLYGPMLVIYTLSFQGPNGGVTFPLVGVSLEWWHTLGGAIRFHQGPVPMNLAVLTTLATTQKHVRSSGAGATAPSIA